MFTQNIFANSVSITIKTLLGTRFFVFYKCRTKTSSESEKQKKLQNVITKINLNTVQITISCRIHAYCIFSRVRNCVLSFYTLFERVQAQM